MCDYSAALKHNLVQHMWSKHTARKKYQVITMLYCYLLTYWLWDHWLDDSNFRNHEINFFVFWNERIHRLTLLYYPSIRQLIRNQLTVTTTVLRMRLLRDQARLPSGTPDPAYRLQALHLSTLQLGDWPQEQHDTAHETETLC